MLAVILVGGLGTRLRPLTATTPKPLLPVGNRPMVEYVLRRLPRAVDDVVFAAAHGHEKLDAYAA
ncbi:MAG: sugar phosphate nucleotidyltransferase, partial [Methanobacteriota archaeon]